MPLTSNALEEVKMVTAHLKGDNDDIEDAQNDSPTVTETDETCVDVVQDHISNGANEDVTNDETQPALKKKKKKKPKKSAKANGGSGTTQAQKVNEDVKSPVLCISRNKHWKYISSYHGPWLQLPVELLQSLVLLNLEPGTVSSNDTRHSSVPPSPPPPTRKAKERGFASLGSPTPMDEPASIMASLSLPPPFPTPQPGKAVPPPIDPGVFRNVTSIRKLIDEAAELSVRASSGLSAAALGALRNGGSSMNLSGSSWSAVQSLGINPMGDFSNVNGGRNASMSPAMVHRLRVLAVQKLAEAYRLDEIASSVMVMQGGSVFDDIAERVLKMEPNNQDARYVHFFHERIPSRQLAESTPTTVLEQLIQQSPNHLHYYRTRGIVHGFRDEYALAVKDFTHALKESRAARRARLAHNSSGISDGQQRGKRKKNKVNGQAPPNGTAPFIEGPGGEQILIHKSILPDAPDPLEPQLLFHRAATYLAHAIFLLESALFKLEGVKKNHSGDLGEIRLSYVENGKYGGTEIGNPDGPLGRSDGKKAKAYRAILEEPTYREQVMSLLKKSKRDYERFLAHFDTVDAVMEEASDENVIEKVERGFQLLDAFRPNNRSSDPPTTIPDVPLSFTTYHPLMIEAHFSALICMLMLGEFEELANIFERTAHLVAGLEGYPVFLPPRSMAQAEFIETLERLAGGWKYAKFPDALVLKSAKSGPVRPSYRPPSRPATPRPSYGEEDLAASSSSAGPSTSNGKTPLQSGRGTPVSNEDERKKDLHVALESLRILLAPVITKQRDRAERAAQAKQMVQANGTKKKAPVINIPLHGPRVEIILAWIASVHLPQLESVAG
ncbi:hypothetical protein SCHPADRAFT_884129 [Schizopora paradoxa]|uniref:TPR-like protein n=1 Tax=Schizopora paradoxa TaxID=27342 RepID=A0A0H2R133_9AGAM|nr:hypothetical protein SCHPADRAFT_884129 [Schizopora paradoxa]